MREMAQQIGSAVSDPAENRAGTSRFEGDEKERDIPHGPRSGCSGPGPALGLHPGPVLLCSRSSH
jgi:hypothetical protein